MTGTLRPRAPPLHTSRAHTPHSPEPGPDLSDSLGTPRSHQRATQLMDHATTHTAHTPLLSPLPHCSSRRRVASRHGEGGRYMSGHHRCRSTQQPRCGSQRCAAFRGFVVPVPPPPARLAGGKTSAHTMHQPGQLDAGREARSSAYMPVPLIDRPDNISRRPVHSQHSSQQSSAGSSHQQSTSFIILAASGDVCSCHVHALRARPGHSQWRLTLGPRCMTGCFTRCPSARPEGHAPFRPRRDRGRG